MQKVVDNTKLVLSEIPYVIGNVLLYTVLLLLLPILWPLSAIAEVLARYKQKIGAVVSFFAGLALYAVAGICLIGILNLLEACSYNFSP